MDTEEAEEEVLESILSGRRIRTLTTQGRVSRLDLRNREGGTSINDHHF